MFGFKTFLNLRRQLALLDGAAEAEREMLKRHRLIVENAEARLREREKTLITAAEGKVAWALADWQGGGLTRMRGIVDALQRHMKVQVVFANGEYTVTAAPKAKRAAAPKAKRAAAPIRRKK